MILLSLRGGGVLSVPFTNKANSKIVFNDLFVTAKASTVYPGQTLFTEEVEIVAAETYFPDWDNVGIDIDYLVWSPSSCKALLNTLIQTLYPNLGEFVMDVLKLVCDKFLYVIPYIYYANNFINYKCAFMYWGNFQFIFNTTLAELAKDSDYKGVADEIMKLDLFYNLFNIRELSGEDKNNELKETKVGGDSGSYRDIMLLGIGVDEAHDKIDVWYASNSISGIAGSTYCYHAIKLNGIEYKLTENNEYSSYDNGESIILSTDNNSIQAGYYDPQTLVFECQYGKGGIQ